MGSPPPPASWTMALALPSLWIVVLPYVPGAPAAQDPVLVMEHRRAAGLEGQVAGAADRLGEGRSTARVVETDGGIAGERHAAGEGGRIAVLVEDQRPQAISQGVGGGRGREIEIVGDGAAEFIDDQPVDTAVDIDRARSQGRGRLDLDPASFDARASRVAVALLLRMRASQPLLALLSSLTNNVPVPEMGPDIVMLLVLVPPTPMRLLPAKVMLPVRVTSPPPPSWSMASRPSPCPMLLSTQLLELVTAPGAQNSKAAPEATLIVWPLPTAPPALAYMS